MSESPHEAAGNGTQEVNCCQSPLVQGDEKRCTRGATTGQIFRWEAAPMTRAAPAKHADIQELDAPVADPLHAPHAAPAG